MKLSIRSIGSLFVAATAIISSASAQDPAPSAKELAKTLGAGIQDGNSVVRLKMETSSKTVLQLQIKSRRTVSTTELVYQVMWPKDRKGEGFLLKKSGSRATSGNLLTLSNTLKNLTATDLKAGIFGSDLSYEDLVENFYNWDDQAILRTEVVDRVSCQVLESKPGGSPSPYSKVQSWIDLKRMVPLRVDKYGSSGKLERRVLTTRVAKNDDGHQVPASFSVQGADLGTPTIIEGSSVKHDVKFTDADFAPAAIGDLK
ncbi:MAG: outer membrane lipoprotein-sorting protein [Luteolibacter sp.]|uniref:outer membrane lipoprotein-sorting protein n=1 Tax=Luteolibacter sp. TaxID=1962973 RepID=UPI003263A2E0